MSSFRVEDDDFWANVDKSGACWLWKGRKTPMGYGWITRKKVYKSPTYAHRWVWYLHTGEAPSRWEFVCHSCDNPSCVNPFHLFLGTTQANTADRHSKGRSATGEGHGMAKLSNELVKEIRRLYSEGGTSSIKLAKQFGVSKFAILQIINRKRWKGVA